MASAEQVARACGLPWLPVDVGEPPAVAEGEQVWRRLGALTGEAELAAQLDVVRSECEGRGDVATAFLAARFAVPLARLAVVPVLTARRALLFSPSDVWLRRDRRGLFTMVRVAAVSFAPGPGGAGGRRDAAAHARAAELVIAGFRPVADGLRRVGRLGDRALWGQLADALIATVGAVLGPHGSPDSAARHAGELLRAADPPLWVRPEYDRTERPGEERLVWRRGSCCLAYLLEDFGLCTTCPLRPRTSWLEVPAGGGT